MPLWETAGAMEFASWILSFSLWMFLWLLSGFLLSGKTEVQPAASSAEHPVTMGMWIPGVCCIPALEKTLLQEAQRECVIMHST